MRLRRRRRESTPSGSCSTASASWPGSSFITSGDLADGPARRRRDRSVEPLLLRWLDVDARRRANGRRDLDDSRGSGKNEIKDYIRYLDLLHDRMLARYPGAHTVVVGFSQGRRRRRPDGPRSAGAPIARLISLGSHGSPRSRDRSACISGRSTHTRRRPQRSLRDVRRPRRRTKAPDRCRGVRATSWSSTAVTRSSARSSRPWSAERSALSTPPIHRSPILLGRLAFSSYAGAEANRRWAAIRSRVAMLSADSSYRAWAAVDEPRRSPIAVTVSSYCTGPTRSRTRSPGLTDLDGLAPSPFDLHLAAGDGLRCLRSRLVEAGGPQPLVRCEFRKGAGASLCWFGVRSVWTAGRDE